MPNGDQDEIGSQCHRPAPLKRVGAGGWTKARRAAFLGEFAQSCNVKRAHAVARMPMQAASIGKPVRVVIGVDPPATAHGDACGIVVAALLAEAVDDLPGAIRHGLERMVQHLYEARDDRERPPPAAIAALWQPWRRLALGRER